MGVYVVTGSFSGMGAAVVARLQAAGHVVVTVDLREADVVADLSTPEGRRLAVDGIRARTTSLDGLVLAAGVGPGRGRDRVRLITQVNYCGVVDLLTGLRPLLAASGDANVVVFASNSTTTVPVVPRRAVAALLSGSPDRAERAFKVFGRQAPPLAYAASKVAVARWVRRTAVTAEWAGAGIRLNALAPGAVMTPLLEQQLATPAQARQIEAFPVPIGGYGDAGHLADWAVFMLSPAADFLCGSVVFVDGGSDAWFRADDWPKPLPMTRTLGYFRRMKQFRQR